MKQGGCGDPEAFRPVFDNFILGPEAPGRMCKSGLGRLGPPSRPCFKEKGHPRAPKRAPQGVHSGSWIEEGRNSKIIENAMVLYRF